MSLLFPPGDVLSARAAPGVGRRASGADVSSPMLKKEMGICVCAERSGHVASRRVAQCLIISTTAQTCVSKKIKISPTEHMAAFSVIKVDRLRGDLLFKVITFPIRGARQACGFNRTKSKY